MNKALDHDTVAQRLKQLSGWTLADGGKGIRKDFSFKNYYPTMAFVNAVAWIANQQDHHPDMTVGYNKVGVLFSTHDAGGLTENDFKAAAKVDALGTI